MGIQNKYILMVSLITLLILVFLFNPIHHVYISKSTFPSWDLLETELKNKTYPLSKKRFMFKHHSNYSSVLDSFINKDCDIATMTIYEALIAYEKLNKEMIIFLLLDYTIGSDGIISNESINYLAQLKGKKIGTSPGTISHYTLIQALERGNLKTSDLTIIYDTHNNLLPLFKNGSLDAISTYDPHIYNFLESQKNYQLLFSSEEIPGSICDVVVAHKDFAEQYPQTLNHIRQLWFNLVEETDNFSRLQSHPSYTNQEYLSRINNSIYLTGESENRAAFKKTANQGYLYTALNDMHSFLVMSGQLSKNTSLSTDILMSNINQ